MRFALFALSSAVLLGSGSLRAQAIEVAPTANGTTPEPTPERVSAPAPEKTAEPVEVTVTGSRLNRAPGSAQVIARRQLERFEYDDPHAVLMQVPGVYIRQEDGVGLRPNLGIRGGNPDRSKKLTLMEDGILFGPAPYSAPAAYYFPLTSRMVRVAVIKGPAAIGYGPQTVGGAVDFVTRPIPSQPSGGADIAFGEYGYDKAHAYAGASNEHFGFIFEFLRIHNRGFSTYLTKAPTRAPRATIGWPRLRMSSIRGAKTAKSWG